MKLSFAVFLSLCGALPTLGNGDGGFLSYLTQDSTAVTPSPAVPPMPATSAIQRPDPLSTLMPAPLARQDSVGRGQLAYTPSYDRPDSPYVPGAAALHSPTGAAALHSPRPGILRGTETSRGALKRKSQLPSPIATQTPDSSPLPPPPKRAGLHSPTPAIPLGQPSQESVEGLPLERSDRIQSLKPEDQLLETARRIILSTNTKKVLEAIKALDGIMKSIPPKAPTPPKTGNSFGDELGSW